MSDYVAYDAASGRYYAYVDGQPHFPSSGSQGDAESLFNTLSGSWGNGGGTGQANNGYGTQGSGGLADIQAWLYRVQQESQRYQTDASERIASALRESERQQRLAQLAQDPGRYIEYYYAQKNQARPEGQTYSQMLQQVPIPAPLQQYFGPGQVNDMGNGLGNFQTPSMQSYQMLTPAQRSILGSFSTAGGAPQGDLAANIQALTPPDVPLPRTRYRTNQTYQPTGIA